MKKFCLMRGVVLGVSLSLMSPSVAQASENGTKITTSFENLLNQTLTEENKAKATEKAWQIWNGLVDGATTIENKVYDSLDNMEFSKDKLWLIEKVGELKEDENRYFFVHQDLLPTIHKQYYYDKYGNVVDENSLEAVAMLDKEMYVSLTNIQEDTFIKMIYQDYKSGEVYVNFKDYVDGEFEVSVEGAYPLEYVNQYIRYQDWTKLISLDEKEDKISLEKLKECINELEHQEMNLNRRR